MTTTITLSASAKYGYGGKQYIARITGRDSKFTFSRDFLGTKSGKRREDAEYQTDEPGLYMTCDIDRKGNKDETYYIVYHLPRHGLTTVTISKEAAMALAKRLDSATPDWTREALTIRLASHEAKPQDELLSIAAQLGWSGKGPRRELVAALKEALGLAEATPEVDPTAPGM